MEEFDVDALVLRQEKLFDSVRNAMSNHKKAGATRRNKIYFETRIEKAKAFEKEFVKNDREIYLCGVDSSSDYVMKSFSDSFDELYLEYIGLLQEDFQTKFPSTEERAVSLDHSVSHSRPPPLLKGIEIPIFEGDYTAWQTFRDLFTALVHSNEHYSAIEKFCALRSVLKGEALQTIQHLSITDEGYTSAWNLLSTQYESSREIFHAHMNDFMSFVKLDKEDPRAMRALLSLSRDLRKTLLSFKITQSGSDPIVVYLISQKLPAYTVGLWETSLQDTTSLPSFAKLDSFLDNRIKTLDAMARNRSISSTTQAKSSSAPFTRKAFHAKHQVQESASFRGNQSQQQCALCTENHLFRQCPRFLCMSINERLNTVRNYKVCSNCLSPSHDLNRCTSLHNCMSCGARHHFLLHQELSHSASTFYPEASSSVPSQINTNVARIVKRRVLLATANIIVQGPSGAIEARALIDKGSEATLVTDRLVKALGLKKRRIQTDIVGIGDTHVESCTSFVDLDFQSYSKKFSSTAQAFVLQKITTVVPSEKIENVNWPHLEGLTLADPEFFTPNKIDVVLGADVYADIVLNGLRKQKGYPTAQNTELGWILFGAYEPNFETQIVHSNLTRISFNSKAQDGKNSSRPGNANHASRLFKRQSSSHFVLSHYSWPSLPSFVENKKNQFLKSSTDLRRNHF